MPPSDEQHLDRQAGRRALRSDALAGRAGRRGTAAQDGRRLTIRPVVQHASQHIKIHAGRRIDEALSDHSDPSDGIQELSRGFVQREPPSSERSKTPLPARCSRTQCTCPLATIARATARRAPAPEARRSFSRPAARPYRSPERGGIPPRTDAACQTRPYR